MADHVVARSRMAEIEDRIGVAPVEELLAERQELVEQVAPLRALYGAGGTWDAQRKMELANLTMLIRAQSEAASIKRTEAYLEDAAHADPRYKNLVAQATTDRANMSILEDKVNAIEARIRRGDAVIRYVSAEARL